MGALHETTTQPDSIASLRLSIDSDISQIYLVAISIRSLVSDLELKDANPGGIELALVELMTNCVTHNGKSNPKDELVVEYQQFEDELHLRTIDSANEVPLEIQLRINSPEIAMQELSLDDNMLPESGWGLSLIKSLSRSLNYERVGNSNVFTLTFALSSISSVS